jgi:hypothetical protein
MSRNTIRIHSLRLLAAERQALRLLRGDPAPRREAAIKAALLLLVTKGFGHHAHAEEVNKLIPEEYRFHTDNALRYVTGGMPALLQRLQAGGAIAPAALGPWTGDFFHGLLMGGGLYHQPEARQWMTPSIASRPALGAALRNPQRPFHSTVCPFGDQLVIRGCWAALQGPIDATGIGVLAGVLAAGGRIIHEKTQWLALAGRPAVRSLLESYGIPFRRSKGQGTGRGSYWVSPFWGALLVHRMPMEFKGWFEGWEGRKAMCPLLPWAFLRMAWGERVCMDIPEGVVPYLVHRNSMRETTGVGVRGLRREVFARYRLSRVDTRLREAWLDRMVFYGVRKEDFPIGKIPLDFEAKLCNDSLKDERRNHECNERDDEAGPEGSD